jgi:anhydro-N-acetylmuramic acid kinase
MKNKYKVVGLMSGTSLDGLDIAYCEFMRSDKSWKFRIAASQLVKYSPKWLKRLSTAPGLDNFDFFQLDSDYGKFLGEVTQRFLEENHVKPDFIASHGHTIFHQPARGFTYQIGDGNAIHAITNRPVVYDFRTLDVMLGGEGAPLVPAGDKFLFSDYQICLNLGGIANLSTDVKKERKAFDICFCNMTLNYLMNSVGEKFDKGGEKASSGVVDKSLLTALGRVYRSMKAKRPSLGREIFEEKVQPLFDQSKLSLEDKLATAVESTAVEIATAIDLDKKSSMLCTGGGAFNSFLVSRILQHCGDNISIIIPEDEIIKFKEALVFAFLGVLKVEGRVNCLRSVTGADRDSSGGVMVGFKPM